MNTLEQRIGHLEDLAEIEQLLNKYIYMLTTMDFDHIFDECFSQTREDVSIRRQTAEFTLAGNTSKNGFSQNLWGI